MKLLPLALSLLVSLVARADDLLPTLMTTRGKLVVDQQFEKPLPPFDGKSNGFASGFQGWRHNSAQRGGHWDVKDGVFTGTENPDPSIKHPATASYGFDFKNVIIQCEVRMNEVPLEGRLVRRIQVRTTDTKDYVCSVMIDEKGWGIEKDDNDHAGPDKAVPLGRITTPVTLGEWHTVVFEILGEEMVGTVDGRSLTGSHSLIASEKHSVMFVAGVQSSVRNFRVWEALPNPGWQKNKAKVVAATTPGKRFEIVCSNPHVYAATLSAMKTSSLRLIASILFCITLLPHSGSSAQKVRATAQKLAPDIANEHYGPHERNVLDLWKAKSDKPTPLVVYIHGGGFRAGSKETINPAILSGLLAKGISVMAINYRFSPEVTFPAHYMDSARSIQYARLHAKEWNLDPKRIGATGGSAGAGTSLWIGFHDDMADPKNADPVLRESTRLSCMAVLGAQSTYDPFVIKEWVGEAAAKHPALEGFYGLKPEQFDTPAAREMFTKAAAITYLSRDDPPVYAYYSEARGPLPPDAKPGQGIHHINFGLKLKEQMDKLGIECTIRHADEKTSPPQEIVDFLVKHLLGAG